MTIASTCNAIHDSFVAPSRAECFGGLGWQVQTVGQHQANPFALLILGLDHFERINASFGYQIGDLLLKEVELRLRQMLGTQTFRRVGGAEFVVILPNGSLTDAAFRAHEILKAIHRPFEIAEFNLGLIARIGLALSQEQEISAHTLLHRARLALSAARNARQDFFVYSPKQADIESQKAWLTSDLRHAIDDDQLFLVYQPKIDLMTGQVAGVEALVRWRHPQLGVISPDQFIPLAEETGLITQLTHSVFQKVLRQCRAWNQAGMATKIATNLSMWDLRDEGFSDQVPGLLASYGVSPDQLGLEITETAIMSSSSRVAEILQCMKKMGLWISIDDFGTGYSSLAYIKNLPVNEIKIDRTFVTNMSENINDTIIVQSVIDLAHKLGLKVVAEGVENKKTKEMLGSFKCDAAQGYYMSKPISPIEFQYWLSKRSQQIPAANADKRWINKVLQFNPFYSYAASKAGFDERV